jgi:hypothetical protein
VAYRALTEVLLGLDPPAQPGDILPDTYRDAGGSVLPVDFERLIDLGAAEPVVQENLEALTRPELDALAATHGVEAPEKLANKPAVIDAIEKARA